VSFEMQEQGESLNLLPQLITERMGNYIRRVTCASIGQQVCLANHFLGKKKTPLLPPQLPRGMLLSNSPGALMKFHRD
ncbi:mCG1042049, partial [Mus musculus]